MITKILRKVWKWAKNINSSFTPFGETEILFAGFYESPTTDSYLLVIALETT